MIENLPKHIGFIIDGNGRWAKKRGFPRSFGHKKGLDRLKKIVRYCKELGVKIVSVFAFSTENWKRPKEEIDFLFDLFRKLCNDLLKKQDYEGVCYRMIGDKETIPTDMKELALRLEEKTKNNTDFTVNFAVNYGGRDEIVRAVNKILKSGKQQITKEEFATYLDTSFQDDPELIIRSSGELRISNFMLYQMAYSEFYFPKTLWPDFNKKELLKALESYSSRKRRFGAVSEDKKWNKDYLQQG